MNSVFFKIGSVQIYWYSVLICLGFGIGAFLALKEAKKWNIPKDYMYNYFFYLAPISIIGARLYYVIFNFSQYKDSIIDIIKIWEGGLAIHGGVIAGILWTIFYTKKYKVNFFKLTDIMVVSLILGQAIGRWGNFLNGEAYGPATTLEYLQSLHIPKFVIDGMLINGVYYQPTFFYESIWCLAGFLFMIIFRNIKSIHISNLTSFYLIWYGIGRFYIESLRTDSLMVGNIKVAQLVSLIAIVLGIIILVISSVIKKYRLNYRRRENEIFY